MVLSRPGLVWVITAALTTESHRHAMQEDRVLNFSLKMYFLLLITSTFKLNVEITVLIRIDCRTLYQTSEVLKRCYHEIFAKSSLRMTSIISGKYYVKKDLMSNFTLFSVIPEMSFTSSFRNSFSLLRE